METILKLLLSLKNDKKKLYTSIIVLVVFVIYFAFAISLITDIDPFIYFKF